MKIKKSLFVGVMTFLLVILSCNLSLAHPTEVMYTNQIVPEQELELRPTDTLNGPKKNNLIESVELVGSVPLENEFASLKGRILRAREITILPNGVVAVHQHQGRPGMAYVLEGELIEYRNDEITPMTRGVGAAAFEKSGVIHWWTNKSSKKARVLVVDIVPQDT